jgi:dynein heavy chain
MNNLRLDEIK